jgi:hypothetical protein
MYLIFVLFLSLIYHSDFLHKVASVLVFVMVSLMTRRSADGMVVIVCTAIMAILVPIAPCIIPIVLDLFQN